MRRFIKHMGRLRPCDRNDKVYCVCKEGCLEPHKKSVVQKAYEKFKGDSDGKS